MIVWGAGLTAIACPACGWQGFAVGYAGCRPCGACGAICDYLCVTDPPKNHTRCAAEQKRLWLLALGEVPS